MVAQNLKGNILKAWVENLDIEVATIKWALEFAKLEKFSNVVVESDAKICIDSLMGVTDDMISLIWNINALCSDINCLALDFVKCAFVWTTRETMGLPNLFSLFAPLFLFLFLFL